MTISTPDSIIENLVEIRRQSEAGIRAQYDAEVKLSELELEVDRIEALAIIETNGTATHKQAVAKIKSAEARLAADIARAEYNRIKLKIRHLELAQSSLQTQARMVELTYRTAGVGER